MATDPNSRWTLGGDSARLDLLKAVNGQDTSQLFADAGVPSRTGYRLVSELARAGYIERRKEGRRVFNDLTAKGRKKREQKGLLRMFTDLPPRSS